MGQKGDRSGFEHCCLVPNEPLVRLLQKLLFIYWDSLHVASICYGERSQTVKISSDPQLNRAKRLGGVRGQSGQMWVGDHRNQQDLKLSRCYNQVPQSSIS